jgi:ABC-type Fe3+ transport system permease subunit
VPSGGRHVSGARGRILPLLACALLVFAAVPAGAAAAGLGSNNSFQELTHGQNEEQTNTTKTTSSSSESGASVSRTLVLAAIAAAVVLLGGIGFVIVRDARRVAPATDLDVLEARSGHDAAVRLRKRRAKAKAARAQRKRNR